MFSFFFFYIRLKCFPAEPLEGILSCVNDDGIVCDESDNQSGCFTGAQSHIRAEGLQLGSSAGCQRRSPEPVAVYWDAAGDGHGLGRSISSLNECR